MSLRKRDVIALFQWAIGRSSYYIRRREWPWRFLWVRSFAMALFLQPRKGFRLLKPLYTGRLSPSGYDLQVHGARVLRIVLDEANKSGIRFFLVWGTLLGCVRERAFIWNDTDIDLGMLSDEFHRIDTLVEGMKRRGFRTRIVDEYKLSLVSRWHPTLFIDIDLVYEKDGKLAITNATSDERNYYTYLFPTDAFSGFKPARFTDGIDVLIPWVPEIFLEAVYGDWKTPQKKADFLRGPLNLVIEPKTVL